ncbi:MAG: hypothetical protein LQ348_005794 [Seirophora lacunosa]|nr:MAG: hypothetical protein LQ348_005794 [Seirophora lacunosa]
MAEARIIVVGAGVAGLTTALLLARESKYQITVAAKHMPGDYDIEYASPWAGANFWPISEAGTEAAEWDKNTWPELEDLAKNHPEAGVHFQGTAIYNRSKDVHSPNGKYLAEKLKSEPWYKTVVPNFRQLSREELNRRLVSDFESIVVATLTGDSGGGTLLGGSYQRGNWDSQLDPNLAVRIMKRAVELCPALTGGKGIEHLDIVRQGVGLRPHRHGGTRIEKERINGVWTVHNYGHGGFGYQSSYGCSRKAVEIIREALSPRPSL